MPEKTRQYPTFPIPAVGALVLNQAHVLLVRRGTPPAQGQWTLPGGVIEIGEAPEEAIVREVQEECGLTIRLDRLLQIVNRVTRDEDQRIRYHYVILDYLARCQENRSWQDALPQAGSDVQEARWVACAELAKFDLTEGVFEIIRDALTLPTGTLNRKESYM